MAATPAGKALPVRTALLFLVPMLGFYQVCFMQFTMKWDIMDSFFQWRYLIAESLRGGILPLWNPYSSLGYPLHADLQSGFWYPVVWLFSLIRPYDIYSLHAEFMLHLVLASTGMYFLSRAFGAGARAALCLGAAYALSGFFTGNAQHLTYIAGAAWIPWVMYFFHRLLYANSRYVPYAFSIACYLLISGGYPALSIITAYIMIVWFIAHGIKTAAGKKYDLLFRKSAWLIFAVALLSVLSAGLIHSMLQSLPHITRGDGVSLLQAYHCPFPVKGLISLVFPFASVKAPVTNGTDLSMTNLYFGIIMLAFLVLSAWLGKRRTWLFMAAGAFFLAASFGDRLPLRAWLYDYVPLFDQFRFPAIFRLFTILFMLLASIPGANKCLDAGSSEDTRPYVLFRRVIVLMLLLVCGTFVWTLARVDWLTTLSDYFNKDAYSFLAGSDVKQHIALQAAAQALLLTLCLAGIKFLPAGIRSGALVFFVMADLVLAVQMNMHATVSSEIRVSQFTANFPDNFGKFPLPDNNPPASMYDYSALLPPVVYNANVFYKKIATDGYNPFALSRYDRLQASGQWKEITARNLAYMLASLPLRRSGPDKAGTVHITGFSVSHFETEVQSPVPQTLVLLQNDYPGWKVKADGREISHDTAYNVFLSARTGAGKHTVTFTYNPDHVRILFIICCTAFAILSLITVLTAIIPFTGTAAQ